MSSVRTRLRGLAAIAAAGGLAAAAAGQTQSDKGKEALVSPAARALERINAGRPPDGGIAGDPNTLLYPLNVGTWTLVDFCVSNCQGAGPAAPPGCNRNDDDTSAVALPFVFTLFGDTYTATNVSNNGNLNFGACNAAFTSTGFPAGNGLAMVAGFWGDVDTGDETDPPNVLGQVWQRFVDSDGDSDIDTFVVTWDNVGYFNEQGNLRNTFQIAISDGSNPLMGIGNNVCFSYSDMAWTTGSASGGVGGFGGTPATVGVNRGDGVDFAQVGRFNQDNANYDGPGGNDDGVHYLDNQNFCFNATGQNICPIPQNFPPGNVVNIAAPGVLDLTVQFSSPEVGQTTTVVVSDVNGAQAAGLVITNTPGNLASIELDWATECGDAGTYLLNFSATDDGSPPCTVDVSLTIVVDCPNQPPVCDAGGPYAAECAGTTTSIALDGSGSSDPDNDPLTYAWTTDCPGGSFDDASSPTPTLTLATGSTCSVACNVTLTVSDGIESVTCTATVTVTDTTAPTITLNGPAGITLECHIDAYVEQGAAAADACDASITEAAVGGDVVDVNTVGTYVVTYDALDGCGNAAAQVTRTVTVVDTTPPDVSPGPMRMLWPPNHKYVRFTIADCVPAGVHDACEGDLDPNTAGVIVSIYSDEPEDARGEGDGRTLNDIVIVNSFTFDLRAERQGGGNGRVYGVTIRFTDGAGNAVDILCRVGVPHDFSVGAAIDDGPGAGYTVTP